MTTSDRLAAKQRSLGVVLRPIEADRLEALAPVCSERQLTPLGALARNRRLPLGALVLEGRNYVVRHVVPLVAGVAVIEWTLEEVARVAAALRAELRRELRQSPELFGNYAA